MKRSIACMVALVMAVAGAFVQPLPARAQTTTTANDKTKDATVNGEIEMNVTAQSLNAENTGEVVVTLAFKLPDAEMMTGFEGYVRYDETALYGPTYELATISGTTGSAGSTGTYTPTLQLSHLNNTRSGLDRILVREANNTPFKPQGVLLTMRFWVIRSVDEATITFDMPKIYNGTTSYAIRDFTRGLSVTAKNPASKPIVLETNNVFGSNLVTIPVKLSSSAGFKDIQLSASYDQSKLKCVSIQPDATVSTKLVQRGSMQTQNGVTTIDFTTTELVSTSGNLFNCTFQILNNSTATGTVKDPELTEVMFEIKSISDYQGSAFNLENAKAKSIVTVTGGAQTLGDVNGDNSINLVDVLYIIQFYNGVRASLTSKEFAAADVNKDGNVNLTDARIILEYYNGKRLYL